MMVTLKIRKVFEGGHLRAQWLTQAINFTVIPLSAYLIGTYFFKQSPYMVLGLLLAGLVPTSGMTISWTGFAKGNVAAAVKMTVIAVAYIIQVQSAAWYVRLTDRLFGPARGTLAPHTSAGKPPVEALGRGTAAFDGIAC